MEAATQETWHLKLGEVAVVVALHLLVKDLCLLACRRWQELVSDDLDNLSADSSKLLFNGSFVPSDERPLVFVALCREIIVDEAQPSVPQQQNEFLG